MGNKLKWKGIFDMNWKAYNDLAWTDRIFADAKSYEDEAMIYMKSIKNIISVPAPTIPLCQYK
jgi:hypothetical protein